MRTCGFFEGSARLLSTKHHVTTKSACEIRLAQGSEQCGLTCAASPAEGREIAWPHIATYSFEDLLLANVDSKILPGQGRAIMVDFADF